MTKNEIITNLFNSKKIQRVIAAGAYGKHGDAENELRSCIFLFLCEQDERKIIDLYETKKIVAYVIGSIIKMAHQKNSAFNKSLNYIPNRVSNDVFIEDDHAYLMDFLKGEPENNEDKIDLENAVNKLRWFESQVLELYVAYGTIKEVAKVTGVTEKYIVITLNAARKKLKSALRIN